MPAPRASGKGRPQVFANIRDSGVVVLTITGELDTAGTRAIEADVVKALSDRTTHAVIDLSGVPFLTSAALALLIVRAQAMKRAGGTLYLAGASSIVREVFRQAGFSSIFPLLPTVNEAVTQAEKDLSA